MVQFSRFASLALCIQTRILIAQWVSPFGYHGIIAFLPASPCFSQAYTSFFAYHRQDPPDALIHLTLSFEEPSDFVNQCVDYMTNLDSLL